MNLQKRNTIREFTRSSDAYLVLYKRGQEETFCCRSCWDKMREYFFESMIFDGYDTYIYDGECGYARGDQYIPVEYPDRCDCHGGY